MRIYYIYRKFGINLTVSFWLQLYTMKNLILLTRVRCGFIFKARRVQVWVLESWVILLYNFGLFNVNNYIEIENNSNFHLLYCLILFNNYVDIQYEHFVRILVRLTVSDGNLKLEAKYWVNSIPLAEPLSNFILSSLINQQKVKVGVSHQAHFIYIGHW